MSHVAHMHESWHIYAWVMLQVWISDTTDRHESTMAASGDVQRQLKHVLCLSGQKTQHMLHLSLPSLRKRVGTSLVYTGEGLFWRIRTHHYRRHKTPKTQDTWRIDRQGWGRQQRMSLRFLCLGCLCETYTLFMCVYVSLDQETYTCLWWTKECLCLFAHVYPWASETTHVCNITASIMTASIIGLDTGWRRSIGA